jgi:hypothetical protein
MAIIYMLLLDYILYAVQVLDIRDNIYHIIQFIVLLDIWADA